jgi:pyruvate kinase
LETDDVKFINQLSSLRPRAYICVFTDNPVVKRLTAINFGVYCFPREFIKNPDQFINTVGAQFVPKSRPEAVVLRL